MKHVYLAGPILGCTEGEAKDWRKLVDGWLKKHLLVCISPLRCEPIVGERYGQDYDDPLFGTARAIGSKNFFDVQSCDMVLAFLPKPLAERHQSFGTLIELGWAFALRKPIVLVSDDPAVVQHAVVNSCAAWIAPNLQDAVKLIVGILGGYNGGKNI